MRRSKEITEDIKSAIRDQFALHPTMSVRQIQAALFVQGYRSVNGSFLDWHYVSKLMRRVRSENIAKLSSESRLQRVSEMKERTKKMMDLLVEIVEGRRIMTNDDIARYPTQTERIAAANTVLRMDVALLCAEETMQRYSGNDEVMEKPEPMLIQPRKESRTKKWARLLPKIISGE